MVNDKLLIYLIFDTFNMFQKRNKIVNVNNPKIKNMTNMTINLREREST